MSIGNLQEGDLKKKREELNRSKGINTRKAVFDTSTGQTDDENPYAMGTRVEQLANMGPLMGTRVHTQNPNDIALGKYMKREDRDERKSRQGEGRVHSEEDQQIIKAQPDLKVFTGEVMEKGVFTPKAKEAARHFFKQIEQWAGSFDDGGSGFYKSLGMNSVMDCLYVDGMSLRTYLNEQYLYKTTGNPAQDAESVRNYIALLAARGEHILTLVRPKLTGDGAGVTYRNLSVDLSELGGDEAGNAKNLKEKGNQVRSDLKKRLDDDITERVGYAYRKAYGFESDAFARARGAKEGLAGAKDEGSPEYQAFNKSFSRYYNGLQKLGLKPGRDDINLAVAAELKNRCEEAIKFADAFIASGGSGEASEAVKKAREALEKDLKLLDNAIEEKLTDENARMRLDELLDSKEDPAEKDDSRDGREDADADTGE